MTDAKKKSAGSNFRKFFLRGLAIVLPSVLTIGILIWAYNFVQVKIASPINKGVKRLILATSPWPELPSEVMSLPDKLSEQQRKELSAELSGQAKKAWEAKAYSTQWFLDYTRKVELEQWWKRYAIGLDLIGLVVAVVLIYILGASLGSLIGRRLYHRGEELVAKVPLIRQVYPSVKQVTDFLFGGAEQEKRMQFNQVVAVEYPRKGLWSIGLVTGDTMRDIQERVGVPCLTVFVPSSPTPFTGYVITVPKGETIELPVTFEQALRFSISGGVIIPPSQVIDNKAASQDALSK